ncbi:hypothetical protein PAXRUDRAFT_499042 [Paxillus rubicundulus Ve08.2h10]|uniref:Uncharacterized protein n=1 Tax=Paxillus rubicundulus Ve08.2h10 TaxID=930991 RepID=A0A0D0D5D3_9AGAM|nr:hypothetical protein PAXRUDRAFT_499042 [Paxillus rubicundulus Ve08.2h10]
MIEGNDDGDVDDVWLWADGDEEWLQQNPKFITCYQQDSKLGKEDLVAAQSALRRRMERAQLTPSPIQKKTANLSSEDHARLREATPAQRLAAIAWLTYTSRQKEDLDFQLGKTFRSKFDLRELIFQWFYATSDLRSIAPFPEQPECWKEFEEKRRAMGCECLRDKFRRERISKWVRMMKWLRPQWNLDVECIEIVSCGACQDRANSLWNELHNSDHSRDIPLLPIQLALSLAVIGSCDESMNLTTVAPLSYAVTAKSLSPNAQRETDECFWPFFSPGERNVEYSTWLNAYPEVMRAALVRFSCQVGPYSQLPSSPLAGVLQCKYLEELPVGFADNAPNLVALVGAVVWMVVCLLDDAPDWHYIWGDAVPTLLQFKGIVLPGLVGTQLELRNHLKRLCLEDGSCFVGPYDDPSDDCWTIYATIIVYVKSLNLGPKFKGCSKCDAAYLTVVTRSGSGPRTNCTLRSQVSLPEDVPSSPPSTLTQSSRTVQCPGQVISSAPASHPIRSENLRSVQADDVEMALPSLLCDTSLPLAERQRAFDAVMRKLVCTSDLILH